MNEREILSMSVDAPPEEVWRAISTRDGLAQWFGYDYDDRHAGAARPAGGLAEEIRSFVDDSELTPPERIAFEDGSALALSADGPRTVVRLVVPDVGDASWEDLYGGAAEGWRFYLEQLRFWLERAPAGRRRTIYLAGEATGAEVAELVGGLVEEGTAWHGASVATAEGHLVSVGADPADPERTHVNVIVNTYGLGDRDFAALRDRWAARWTAVVKEPEIIPAG